MGVVVEHVAADSLEAALDAAESQKRRARLRLVAPERQRHAERQRGVLAVVTPGHRGLRLAGIAFAPVDDRTGAVPHEVVEDLVHLLLRVVVGGGVGDDRRVGTERHERAIALVHLGDGVFAAAEADRPFPAGHVRAVDAERVEPALGEHVPKHRRDGGLAACPGNGYEPVPRKRT